MITKYFTDKGILKTQPEVTDSTYSMIDDGGVEVEVGEFLYGLVRILKPKKVLTTGIYTGVSDLYIAQGLKDNGFGISTALEYEQTHIKRAKELWIKAGVSGFINETLTSSLDFNPQGKYQLMFLDTEPQIRFKELLKFYPNLDEGGYLFIHDCPRNMCQGNINPDHPEIKSWPFGDIPNEMKDILYYQKLVKFHLPSPRGLVGFYKKHGSDYR